MALGVIFCLVAGCATSDAGRTKAEGTGFGALLGAGLGAGIGALVGGKNGAALGAGIGAAVGAGAGYYAGSSVAKRKSQYASKEDQLDGEITYVATYNSDLKKYNEQTTASIADLNQQIADLKVRIKDGESSASELRYKKNEIKALSDEAAKKISFYKSELTQLAEYRKSLDRTQDQVKVATLDKEVSLLRQNIIMLDRSNKQMAKLAGSFSVRK